VGALPRSRCTAEDTRWALRFTPPRKVDLEALRSIPVLTASDSIKGIFDFLHVGPLKKKCQEQHCQGVTTCSRNSIEEMSKCRLNFFSSIRFKMFQFS
jgi:hypothetical protein